MFNNDINKTFDLLLNRNTIFAVEKEENFYFVQLPIEDTPYSMLEMLVDDTNPRVCYLVGQTQKFSVSSPRKKLYAYLLANNINILLTEKSFVGKWSVNFSADGSGRFIFVLGIPAKLSPESIAELMECGIETYIKTRDNLNDFADKIEENEAIAIETLVPGAASGNNDILVSFHPILEALLDDNFEEND